MTSIGLLRWSNKIEKKISFFRGNCWTSQPWQTVSGFTVPLWEEGMGPGSFQPHLQSLVTSVFFNCAPTSGFRPLSLVTAQFSTVQEPSQLKAWIHTSIHSSHFLSLVWDCTETTSVCQLAHQQADALLITSWISCHNPIRSMLCLE